MLTRQFHQKLIKNEFSLHNSKSEYAKFINPESREIELSKIRNSCFSPVIYAAVGPERRDDPLGVGVPRSAFFFTPNGFLHSIVKVLLEIVFSGLLDLNHFCISTEHFVDEFDHIIHLTFNHKYNSVVTKAL